MREIVARFQKGSGAMEAHYIDYYREGAALFCIEWAMGGETVKRAESVPDNIDGFIRWPEGLTSPIPGR